MPITAIWGPPNSGKTTLAIDLAYAISRRGKTVCLISPEPFSELSQIFSVKLIKPQGIEMAYHVPGSLKQAVFQIDSLLFILAAQYFTDAFGDSESLPEVKSLLSEASVTFEHVIVDCPSTANNTMAAWAINQATSVLLLTGFCSTAAAWYQAFNRAIGAFPMKAIPICVQGSDSFDYRGLSSVLSNNNSGVKISPKVWVPFFPGAEAVQRQRRTLYDYSGKVGKAYTAAIDEICDEVQGGRV